MNLLIHSGTVVTLKNAGIIKSGGIAVEDQTIVDVGKTRDLKKKYGRGYERIDATGKVIVPGLINTHQHAAMSLLRGYADDLPLQEWLEKWIWPIEEHMTPADIYAGALLTAVESIMGGTTTINTMYHYTPEHNEAKAFADAGIRGIVGHVCFSRRKRQDQKALEDLVKNWHNKHEGLTRASIDPHSPYTVDPEYLKELKIRTDELNMKYGSEESPIIWHTHAAETADEPGKIHTAFGIRPKDGIMNYLDSLGVLDGRVLAVHCVALTDKDIGVMRKRRVKVSHCPVSNLKLASGVSPIPRLVNEGITVSIGTDSPCSNNTADMFEAMKITALLHKGMSNDPTVTPAQQVLEMATTKAAEALSWQKEIGSIETGKKADLAIVDFQRPHLRPLHNEISNLIYAARAGDVETVVINGKVMMENRKMTTLDAGKVAAAAEKSKNDLLVRLNKSNK